MGAFGDQFKYKIAQSQAYPMYIPARVCYVLCDVFSRYVLSTILNRDRNYIYTHLYKYRLYRQAAHNTYTKNTIYTNRS